MSVQDTNYYFQFFPPISGYTVCPILSALSNVLVIFSCVYFKTYTSSLGKMILWINIWDFCYTFMKAFGTIYQPRDDLACQVFQGIAQVGLLSSVIWGSFFAHALLKVIENKNEKSLKRFMKYYVSSSLIVSFGLSGVLIFTGSFKYEKDLGECIHWIYYDKPDYSTLFYLFIPILVCCALSIVWFVKAANRFENTLGEGKRSKYFITLMVYPAIVLFCWTPMLVVFIFVFAGNSQSHSLVPMVQALNQLQGFFDAMVYGKGSYTLFVQCFRSLCGKPNNSNPANLIEYDDDEVEGAETEDKIYSSNRTQKEIEQSPASYSLREY